VSISFWISYLFYFPLSFVKKSKRALGVTTVESI
jgi:hypothetical protein